MMATRTNTANRPTRRWDIRVADGREDAFTLARLWDHYFGVMYEPNRLPWPCSDIAGWIDDEDRPEEDGAPLATCGLLAEHEDVRIGGAIATIEDHEKTVRELPDGRFDAEALAGERNCWLQLGAVDPAWRGHGIGRKLFEYRIDWARAQGASILIGIGWERDGRSSRPLFELHNFAPIQRFPDYYADNRDQCPDCGVWKSDDSECRCEMTLWAREVTTEDQS